MTFQPGQSGNPNGPPKATRIWKEAILRAVKRREDKDPLALEKLADKLIRKVEEGDVGAIKEFGDRVDGKVPQAVIGGGDDQPAIAHKHEVTVKIVD
jgi:hypothetical protein